MRRSIIPPRTMSDICKKTRQGTANTYIGDLVERLNRLKSELSSRIEEARKRNPEGHKDSNNSGFHFSIGSLGIGNAGSARGRASEQESTPIHMYKPQKKTKTASISYAPQIECQTEIMPDYDSEGGLCVILEFKGLSFSDGAFTISRKTPETKAYVCYAPVKYDNKDVFLILSSIEDILELEVVPEKSGIERMFSREIYIPELTGYNAASMEAVKRKGIVLVSYKNLQRE